MLVLTRKTNQSIVIGDDIEVTVLAVSRDKIRLGITAPREIPVYRKEIYLSINDEDPEDAGSDTRSKVDSALGGLAADKRKGAGRSS
ncbi:MAG: carbon storage regulator [Solirubrobacterales bacterium]|jgi:carbon storage regulator|nr:carbon storage regulator [Solirubrobacterales bacterium]